MHLFWDADLASSSQCLWDLLPEELKIVIWSKLTNVQLAAAASTCREYAAFWKDKASKFPAVKIRAGRASSLLHCNLCVFKAGTEAVGRATSALVKESPKSMLRFLKSKSPSY